MQVVIIAGGFATRLGELTKRQPKSMLSFGGKPFLEHQIEFLRRAGCTDIVLCLGHLSKSIVDYFGDGHKLGVTIRYSIEEKPLGTAGALKKAAPLLQNTFFTLYGDSYLFHDCGAINAYFEKYDKLALMTVFENHDKFDKSNTAIEGNFVIKYSKVEKTAGMQTMVRHEVSPQVEINQIAEFRSCITCVYRKFYPPTTRNGQPVFYRFYCSLAEDSQKDIVKPEDTCGCWKGITLDIE